METNTDTLFCPTCGYNLTGLPENRCPECGKNFNPVELRRRLEESAIQPIRLGETITRLIALPGIFLITQGTAIVSGGASLPLVLIAGLFWLFGSMVVARTTAVRLAVSGGRTDEGGRPARSPWFIPCCTIGLYFVQIAIGAGPCAVVALSFTFGHH